MKRRTVLALLGLGSLFPGRRGRAEEVSADPTQAEAIGELRIGHSAAQLRRQLGAPAEHDREVFSEATGTYQEQWEYPERGLTFILSSKKRGGAKSVAAIKARPPCRRASRRGIRLGSTITEVRRAYAKQERKELSDPEHFIAGSGAGRIYFKITDGRVSLVCIGTLAE